MCAVPRRDPSAIGRLVIHSLGDPSWWPSWDGGGPTVSSTSQWAVLEQSMLHAIANLRLLIQDSSCAAVVTCPAGDSSELCSWLAVASAVGASADT